ncbi:enoyl-CoA hydratase [Mycolicibacterium aubagnense]|uniref:Enoyl-CoA hydratase n=1 Tax=Mycolicibacterium aubagnense TaxID=319707 RepID=A0ABN5YX74_9MYCO|nr:enoyl-CoA hydratase [Mycolicibacterium aubagnense]TLH67895.1 enoyl-CoA hydratase [Mycolicibacterium aubagnense]WGI31958.1 enoyl-CoA hydratase [Mycolicibacterium aubagnense]BBX86522.1 enoyl-CoA hydratase [Mycolicibacterium aubagnense]
MTYTGSDDLTVALADGVLSVTLNRPDTLNSLSLGMLELLGDAVLRAATDPEVKVVRLGGAGRGFCSGAGLSAEDQDAKFDAAAVLNAANRAVAALVNLPKPAVAVVHGVAAGVGVSLALGCDIVLASEKSSFLLAFTKIGLMPDGGASALVAASIGRARAMRMALLAEKLPAAEAYAAGLVSSVHAADDLDAEVDRVLTVLTSGPAVALRKTKQAVNDATLTELNNAFAREAAGQIQLLHAADFREGVASFQQRRLPVYSDV